MSTEKNKSIPEEEFVDVYEQNHFEHALINFEEEVNEYNSRNILPAFPTKNAYLPISPDSGNFIK